MVDSGFELKWSDTTAHGVAFATILTGEKLPNLFSNQRIIGKLK